MYIKKKTDVNNIHILEAACVVHVRFNEPFTECILKRTRDVKTTKILPVSGLHRFDDISQSFYYLFFLQAHIVPTYVYVIRTKSPSRTRAGALSCDFWRIDKIVSDVSPLHHMKDASSVLSENPNKINKIPNVMYI